MNTWLARWGWILLLGFTLPVAAEETWPQWRGPQRDGTVDKTEWPDSLSKDNLQQVWRVELEPSYSGPIVSEKLVFVTETQDAKREVVTALDRKSGEKVWQTGWDGSMAVPFFAAANGSWIRSTPAYDGESLYVAGMRDVLVCLEAKTGKERWRVNFMERYDTPLPAFGFVCSPLIVDDAIYVQAGGSFVKLNKKTGETIWRKLEDGGGMWGSAFSSPVYETVQGKPQLLVQTRTKLAGVSPKSGDVLWSQEIPAFRGMNILTPSVYKQQIFTSSYGGNTLLFELSQEQDSVKKVWENKLQGYMSSPIVLGDYAYLHLRNQRFACVDLRSGKTQWITKPFGKYWSMVTNGKKILALDQRGELLLIQANPERFELLGKTRVSEQSTWAHLAVCGNELFIRELQAMTVFRWGEN